VNLALTGRRKPEVIHELAVMLKDAGRIPDVAAVEAAILERETLTTTGIGGGIAIPHCLTPEVDTTILGVARSKKPVKFDAVDKKPCHLFFVMVGPPNAHNEHLRLLSRLARYLHDTRLKHSLLSASSAEEVIRLFEEREAG
jgi:fructose-specific phosphotransferase system IIA component